MSLILPATCAGSNYFCTRGQASRRYLNLHARDSPSRRGSFPPGLAPLAADHNLGNLHERSVFQKKCRLHRKY
jgi:hypothetical protein